VAKSANLLVDALGHPDRVGLLLPLHWQTVALLLAGVTTGATVVLADDAAALVGCGAAFVSTEHAEAALDAGVDDVLALSGHPLGAPAAAGLPAMVLDYAREVPSYADHFGGPRPGQAQVEAGGRQVEPLTGLSADDRVLTALDPADGTGAGVLLGALRAGASLVLLRAGDPEAVAAAERVTITAGCDVSGLTRRA
jgi:uncharacterized protein (TIGR03089 family)